MGLLDRIFGGGKRKVNASAELTPQTAMEIVGAFGDVMESGPIPGLVADVRTLPYPKPRIKEALRYAISLTEDKQMREHLVQAYVSLADYQEGVGRDTIGIDSAKVGEKHGGDLHKMAAEVADQGDAYQKWKPLVEAELKASFAELRKLGLLEGLD